MRPSVNAELAMELAQCAGFAFDLERCRLLAPQIEWLLAEAARIEALRLPQAEPLGFFKPGEVLGPIPEGQGTDHE